MARSPYAYFEPERAAKLANMSLVARQVVEGFISGLHRSPHRGFSVEFSEHRQYSPGDDLRHLDWVAWARTDRYYVKQYEEETNLRAHILLDCSASMGYRYSPEKLTKLEYGCYLAAALAFLMIRQQDAVGVVRFSDTMEKFIPPKSGPAHLREILIDLENVALGPLRRVGVRMLLHDLAKQLLRAFLLGGARLGILRRRAPTTEERKGQVEHGTGLGLLVLVGLDDSLVQRNQGF